MAAKENDVPDDDSLSYDDLPAELAHGGSTPAGEQHPELMVPLGLQAEVDTTADTWAVLWKEYTEYMVTVDPDDASRLEPLAGADVYYAAMSFPIGTGLGADNLAPRAIARLPRRALQVLADLLNLMEDEECGPRASASFSSH